MLKFFRRIRQNLLSENKFGKYLIYTVGEITLVMIGILLALQVNNWNQGRVDQKLERVYLENFLRDLRTDSLCLAHNVYVLQNEKKVGLEIINNLLKDPDYCCQDSMSKVIRNSAFLGWAIHKERSTATIDELVSSGNLKLISNQKLRVAITEYYAFWDHALERQNQRKSNYPHLTYKLFDREVPDDDPEWFYETIRQNNAEVEFRKEFRHELRYADFLENVTLKYLIERMHYLVSFIEMELSGKNYALEKPSEDW